MRHVHVLGMILHKLNVERTRLIERASLKRSSCEGNVVCVNCLQVACSVNWALVACVQPRRRLLCTCVALSVLFVIGSGFELR